MLYIVLAYLMLFAALTNSVCLNNASFFFLFKYFLCQGYELSGEIALKNNHYYYYYYYSSVFAVCSRSAISSKHNIYIRSFAFFHSNNFIPHITLFVTLSVLRRIPTSLYLTSFLHHYISHHPYIIISHIIPTSLYLTSSLHHYISHNSYIIISHVILTLSYLISFLHHNISHHYVIPASFLYINILYHFILHHPYIILTSFLHHSHIILLSLHHSYIISISLHHSYIILISLHLTSFIHSFYVIISYIIRMSLCLMFLFFGVHPLRMTTTSSSTLKTQHEEESMC